MGFVEELRRWRLNGRGERVAEPPACVSCRCEVAERTFSGGGMEIFRCYSCGLLYRDPALAEGSLPPKERRKETGYEEFFGNHDLRVEMERERLLRVVEMTGRAVDGLRVLEVGASTGAMGALLEPRCDYVGLEADPDFCRVAEQINPRLKGRMLCGAVEEIELPREGFDLIFGFHVLEHFAAPASVLRRLFMALAPGGRVFMEVPDEGAVDASLPIRRALRMNGGGPTHPGHISLFSEDTLLSALGRSGLVGCRVLSHRELTDPGRVRAILARSGLTALARPVAWLVRAGRADLALGVRSLIGVGGRD